MVVVGFVIFFILGLNKNISVTSDIEWAKESYGSTKA
jgi:hypothetical protein